MRAFLAVNPIILGQLVVAAITVGIFVGTLALGRTNPAIGVKS